MKKTTLILTVILIISIITNIVLVYQRNVFSEQKDKAILINAYLLQYLKNIDYRCTAKNYEFDKILDCLNNLNKKFETLPVEYAGYSDFDSRTNTSGYLIIKNIANKDLKSKDFILYKNHKVEDTGCVIPGTIANKETCKLFFNSRCERGDVLEIKYQGERAHIHTC